VRSAATTRNVGPDLLAVYTSHLLQLLAHYQRLDGTTQLYDSTTVQPYMPISIDRFERAKDMPTGERIVRFLATNSDKAFTRSEIATAIEVDPNTVGTNLSRLKERGLVRHIRPHWAITDDEQRLASAFKTHYENEYLNEVLGPYEADREEVLAHAASPEEFGRERERTDD
jgi:Mn-dependent DtxR family transcriptional regulator